MEYTKWYIVENPSEVVIRDSENRTVSRVNKSHPNGQANAHLIASAPDLYEACKKIASELSGYGRDAPYALADIKQAIAKVEGG